MAWKEVAERYIASFQEDMAALGVPPAKIEPKATEHIPEMLDVIGRLVDQGFAYQGAADGDVYFRVRRFPGYGKLSGQNLEDMESGARIEVDRGEGGSPGFRPVEGQQARGTRLGQPLGTGAAGLAHRVLRHEHEVPGRDLRHPRRRPGSGLPPP